jgi:hypothetical protein
VFASPKSAVDAAVAAQRALELPVCEHKRAMVVASQHASVT